MPNIWIASFNQGKLKEFKTLFKDLPFEVRLAKEFEFYRAPEETGSSFLENALLKAKAFKPLVNEEDWVIGEDSGLEVEALEGLPGIHSARYAGPKALDTQNNDKLLKMLNFKKTSNRNARYFCQIVALGPENTRIETSGTCEGEIGFIPKGKFGFGYDPLFIPKNFEKTMAELTPAEKNKISHRKAASENLISKLKELYL